MRLLVSALLLLSVAVQGGTYPFYYYLTQHTQNQLLYNPAYAGSTDKLNLHLHSMTGMYKVTGTRSSSTPLNVGYVAFDRPCPTIRGAWGAYLLFDAPGVFGRYYNMSFGGNYAYRWQINDDHRLQFGAGINFRRFAFDRNAIFSDPNANVPLVELRGRTTANHLDFSLGTWYQHKKLSAGISLTHFGNFYMAGIGDNFLGTYTPIVNVYAAYDIELMEDFNMEPYLYFASAGRNNSNSVWGEKAQISLGFMADYKKSVFLGLGYSHQQVISPSMGFQLKKMIRFQGTYNYVINQQDAFLRYHNFEISLTVQLDAKKKDKKQKD